MSCKYNSLGQPACRITFHPDYPQEKFCVNCRQRFYQNILPPGYYRDSQEDSKGVFVLIIVLLMLVILFRAIPSRSSNTNPMIENNQFETLISYL